MGINERDASCCVDVCECHSFICKQRKKIRFTFLSVCARSLSGSVSISCCVYVSVLFTWAIHSEQPSFFQYSYFCWRFFFAQRQSVEMLTTNKSFFLLQSRPKKRKTYTQMFVYDVCLLCFILTHGVLYIQRQKYMYNNMHECYNSTHKPNACRIFSHRFFRFIQNKTNIYLSLHNNALREETQQQQPTKTHGGAMVFHYY